MTTPNMAKNHFETRLSGGHR